jgi:chromosomal replication initiation ATPase DnaA
MQLASYRNTEAGARERQRQRFEAQLIVLEERKERMAEEIREMNREREAQEERLRAVRSDALSALRDANRALAKFGLTEKLPVHCVKPDQIKRIAVRICKVFGITHKELTSHRRNPRLVLCRQAIAYWACRRTNRSLPQIGKYLCRDHTTLIHSKGAYPVKRAAMNRNLREVR